jgi:hypothetical protein
MARFRSIVSISLATGDDPIADPSRTRNASSCLCHDLGPDDPGSPRLGQLDRHRAALRVALDGAAHHVVDVQHPARLLGADVAVVKREHRPPRDDEQDAQLGEPGDHVVGERVREPAAGIGGRGPVDERHYRNGGAAGRRDDEGVTGRRHGGSGDLDARRGGGVGPRRLPGVAKRRGIEALALEQPRGRRQMLLAFPDLAASGERAQQELVDARIEGRQLEPLLEVRERLVVGQPLDEMLEQGGVAAAESPALGGEPAVEDRAAADLEALEELAAELRGQRTLPVWRKLLDFAGRAGHRSRRRDSQSEPHGVAQVGRASGRDRRQARTARHQRSSPRGSFGTSGELTVAPPRCGARDRGESSARTAGRRERHGGAPPDRQAEQPDVDRGRRPGPAQPGEFLGNSHGGYHGGSHVGRLRSGSTVTARRWSGARMTAVADARRSIEGRRGEMTWTQAP